METPPPQPQQPYQAPAPQQSQQPQEKCTLALVSMILGIGSFFTWVITGIPAIICGHVAHSKIKKSGGSLSGSGMATTGLICGYVSTVLIFIFAILAAIATPVILKTKHKADEIHASANGKQIFIHLVEYHDTHGKLPDTLDDLETSGSSYNAADLKPKKGDWQYHGAEKNLSAPPYLILLSWYQEQTDKWVIIRMDGALKTLKDKDYQAALHAQESP